MTYGRAIFGDNQFLGVNHSNQAKGAELYERFKKPDAILCVLDAAYSSGIRDFMFTTHDRYVPVFEEIIRSNLFPGMHYTPCMPYAHKYWNTLSEKGLTGLLGATVAQLKPFQVVQGSASALFGRTTMLVSLLTELETLMCRGLPLRGVFLQNAAVDFLLAMELHSYLDGFAAAVNRLGIEPGFITMNHPKAVDVLCDRIGLDRPLICGNFNLGGFRMHPSPGEVMASFASSRSRNIAMSVFSSGGAPSGDALRWVTSSLRLRRDRVASSAPRTQRISARTLRLSCRSTDLHD